MAAVKKKMQGKQLLEWVLCFLIIAIVTAACNWLGYDTGLVESIPGVLIIAVIATVGMALATLFPRIPSTLWVMIVAMLCGAPFFPFAEQILEYTNMINLSAIVPCILAYAGISIGSDWGAFVKLGWKAIIVGCMVMLGTFVCSGLIAEVML